MGSINVPNLVPGKAYAVQVRAVGSSGAYSDWSETILFTAPQDLKIPLNNSYSTALSGKLEAGTSTTKITINGETSPYSIFTTLSGVATTYSGTENGFILDTDSTTTRMRLKGASGSLNFDGNNLSITGAITATSGQIGGWSIDSQSLYYGTANNTGIAKIYIGAGNWNTTDTGFYVDQSGYFSLGQGLTWNPTAPGTLQVNGILRGYINDTTAAPSLTGQNTMGVGLYNASNSPDGIYGVGLKINSNNYWFADTTPRLRVGSTASYLNWDGSVLNVRGTLNVQYVTDTGIKDITIGDAPAGSSDYSEFSGMYIDSGNYWLRNPLGEVVFGVGLSDGDRMEYFDGALNVMGSINATSGYLGGETVGWNIGSDGILSSGELDSFVGIASSDANVSEYVFRNIKTLKYVIDDEYPDYYDPDFPGDFYDYGTIYFKIPTRQPAFTQFTNSYDEIDYIFIPKWQNVSDAITDNTITTSTGWTNSGYNTSLLNNRRFSISSAENIPYSFDTVSDPSIGGYSAVSPSLITAVTSVPSITVTNYIGNGTTLVTATVSSTADMFSGDVFKIVGATGTEQTKLNGVWTIFSVTSATTFTFIVSSTVVTGTYTTGLGTTTRITKNITYTTDIPHGFYSRAITTASSATAITLTTATSNTKYLTYTTGTTAHGINEGDIVTIASTTVAGYNLTSQVVYDVPTTTTFRLTNVSGTVLANATGGTVTKNNHITVASATGIYEGMMVKATSASTDLLRNSKTAKITAYAQSAYTVTFTSVNNLSAGDIVTVYDMPDINFNFNSVVVQSATSTSFTVTSSITQTVTTITGTNGTAIQDSTYVISVNGTDIGLSMVPSATLSSATVSFSDTAGFYAIPGGNDLGSVLNRRLHIPSTTNATISLPSYKLSAVSGSGSAITYTTLIPHDFVVGDLVLVSDVGGITGYNSTTYFTVASVPTSTTFTVTSAVTGTATSMGCVQLYSATGTYDLTIDAIATFETNEYLWISFFPEEALSGAFKLHTSVSYNSGTGNFTITGGTEGQYTTTGLSQIPLAIKSSKTYILWAGSENPVSSDFTIASDGTIEAKKITLSSTTSDNGLVLYETDLGVRGNLYFDSSNDSVYLNSQSSTTTLNLNNTGGTTLVGGMLRSYGYNVVISDETTTNVARLKSGVTGAVAVTATNGSSTAFTITYGGVAFASQPYVVATAVVTTNTTTNSVFAFSTDGSPGTTSAAFRGQRVTGDTTTGISFMWIATNA